MLSLLLSKIMHRMGFTLASKNFPTSCTQKPIYFQLFYPRKLYALHFYSAMESMTLAIHFPNLFLNEKFQK